MKGLRDLKAWTSKDSLENREHVEKLQRVNNLFQTRRQEEKFCSSHHRFHFKALFNVPMFSVTRGSVPERVPVCRLLLHNSHRPSCHGILDLLVLVVAEVQGWMCCVCVFFFKTQSSETTSVFRTECPHLSSPLSPSAKPTEPVVPPRVPGAAGAAETGVVRVGAQSGVNYQLAVGELRLVHALRRHVSTCGGRHFP